MKNLIMLLTISLSSSCSVIAVQQVASIYSTAKTANEFTEFARECGITETGYACMGDEDPYTGPVTYVEIR